MADGCSSAGIVVPLTETSGLLVGMTFLGVGMAVTSRTVHY